MKDSIKQKPQTKEKFLLGQRRSGNLNALSCIGQHSLDVGSVQKIKKKCLGRKQMSSFAWQSPIVRSSSAIRLSFAIFG